jgi:signal transduction histidine kinase|nr:ATP-binding protein [Candidatus Krumholzibacteria bacterium]
MADSLQHHLQERVKELTALHSTARLLQNAAADLDEVMPQVAALIPPAWQFPLSTECRLTWGQRRWATGGFRETPWQQIETITLRGGEPACMTVVYTVEHPAADEGPFLNEERELIRSLADMIRAFLQHRLDDQAILEANSRLEKQVQDRTADLRRLSRELCLAEERERRRIAEDLHDHLGQGLALIKMRLQELRGNSALSGHNPALAGLVTLSDQAIRYTRGLTFELSPPVLYELGLGPALDWLGENLQRKHGLKVKVIEKGSRDLADTARILLWKCCRELTHNVVKHAQARKMTIQLEYGEDHVHLVISDDGVGFDYADFKTNNRDHFGLFAIEERLRDLGGCLAIESTPGHGCRITLEVPLTEGSP